MTDPTPVDDIYIVGQRRRSVNDGRPSAGPQVNPLPTYDNPQNQGGDDVRPPPCSTVAGRREWNADAAAAEAWRQIKAKAAELAASLGVADQIYRREFGAQIYQRPNGSIYVGPVTWGPNRQALSLLTKVVPRLATSLVKSTLTPLRRCGHRWQITTA